MTKHVKMDPDDTERVGLHQTYQDWELGLAGYCRDNPDALPAEVKQAWDDMNAAWTDIKDCTGNIPANARQKFDAARDRLQDAWRKMENQ
ncbi:MAG: hypothetical protein ABID63_10025 [Pseudomonadota bacterium]